MFTTIQNLCVHALYGAIFVASIYSVHLYIVPDTHWLNLLTSLKKQDTDITLIMSNKRNIANGVSVANCTNTSIAYTLGELEVTVSQSMQCKMREQNLILKCSYYV